MKRGFTLIELLIVVAIIAILAAIAVPNFLEAQTRAKTSRTKSDLRTMATAVEAYTVDHNRPPREQSTTFYGPGDQLTDQNGNLVNMSAGMWNGVSTPIAYITTARYFDVFQTQNQTVPYDEQFIIYHNLLVRSTNPLPTGAAPSQFFGTAPVFYGNWRMYSVGPDRRFAHPGTAPTVQLSYDPTNGTISMGNIWRASTFSDSKQPDPGRTYTNGGYSAILLGG